MNADTVRTRNSGALRDSAETRSVSSHFLKGFWSRRADSNRRPADYESAALARHAPSGKGDFLRSPSGARTSRGFVPPAWGVRWLGNGADSEPGGWLGALVWSVRRTDPHAISRLTHPRGERRGLFRPKRETETGPGRAFGLHSPARAHSGGWLMLGRCHLIRHIESPWRSGERTRPHPRIPYRTTAIGRGENARLRRGGASRMVVSAWDSAKVLDQNPAEVAGMIEPAVPESARGSLSGLADWLAERAVQREPVSPPQIP